VATWAVNTEFMNTGGGLIFAVGPVAKAISDYGVGVDTSAAFDISTETDGYLASRGCVTG
jgi:hypothetical protein